jgi:hypothetical protein
MAASQNYPTAASLALVELKIALKGLAIAMVQEKRVELKNLSNPEVLES